MPASNPGRGVYRSQEVCEMVEVQPYVLKSWEAEFPELGVAKTPDGPRIYRRADVDLVVKLKDLLFTEGLTLAGARRRLMAEGLASSQPVSQDEITDSDVAALLDKQARRGLRDVRDGLGFILDVLNRRGTGARLASRPVARVAARGTRPAKAAKREKVESKGRPSRKPGARGKSAGASVGRPKRSPRAAGKRRR